MRYSITMEDSKYVLHIASCSFMHWMLTTADNCAHNMAFALFTKDESGGMVEYQSALQECRISKKPPAIPMQREKFGVSHIEQCVLLSFKNKAWLMVTGCLWPCIRAQLGRINA